MSVVLSGQVVELETKTREVAREEDGRTVVVREPLHIAHVLDGRYVRACLVSDEYLAATGGELPVADKPLAAEVVISINRDGKFGASLQWRLVRPVTAPAPARAAS